MTTEMISQSVSMEVMWPSWDSNFCRHSNLCSLDLQSWAQSIVSLTSSLVVKMLTVLVSTISNSQVFLLQKY